MSKTIDLVRVKKALATLDKIALEHPELIDKTGQSGNWSNNLELLDVITEENQNDKNVIKIF